MRPRKTYGCAPSSWCVVPAAASRPPSASRVRRRPRVRASRLRSWNVVRSSSRSWLAARAGASASSAPAGETRWINAFSDHVRSGSGHFVELLDEAARRLAEARVDLALLHDVISTLRRELLPCLSAGRTSSLRRSLARRDPPPGSRGQRTPRGARSAGSVALRIPPRTPGLQLGLELRRTLARARSSASRKSASVRR